MKKSNFPIIRIIGLPGAGKTTLGRQLSKNLGLQMFCIGKYRARYPRTVTGEADAWVALFRALSARGWKNCILETTGLNFREEFLRKSLPFGQMITVKLDASRKTLYKRIRQKKKSEQGGDWLYSATYKDKHEFVRKLFKKFNHIAADYCINTSHWTKSQVLNMTLKEIKL